MKIGGYVKSSLIDYPGKISAVIFTQGCPFRCKFCHNAQLVIPELFSLPISEEMVLQHLQQRRGKLEGVVITGGEPTIQTDLVQFVEKIKSLGYCVKLDTMGYFPRVVEQMIKCKLVDYIAMDIKAPFAKYREVVGVPTDVKLIKESISLIRECGIEYEFRTTAPPQLLSPDDLFAIARELRGAKRYVLQQFRAFRTLDPALLNTPTYPIAELRDISERISNTYLPCFVR